MAAEDRERHAAGAKPVAFVHVRAHLHPTWRYGLALAWAAALVGLLVPENSGYDLGKQPSWWDFVLVVVAVVGLVIVAIVRDWRWAPLASVAVATGLIVLALPDLSENTGIAVKQLVIGAGILLVSIGSLSAWDPSRATTPGGPAGAEDQPA
jgi:phosphatidylserine synthase